MEIPYTVKPRPDTGLYNAKLGIWLFLASEVMLFGALFSAYILLRVGADEGTWPKGLLNVPLGTINTLVLITSSITVVMAWVSLKMNQFGKFRMYQAITLLCALGFLGIKSVEYKDKFSHYQILKTDGTYVDGHMVEKTDAHVVIDGITATELGDINNPKHGEHARAQTHHRSHGGDQENRQLRSMAQHLHGDLFHADRIARVARHRRRARHRVSLGSRCKNVEN